MNEKIADLIIEYVANRVNFKSVNDDNIDRVAGRISIEFCKMYSPRKNWDVARKDIKALITDILRDVMDGRLVFVFKEAGDSNE